MNLHMGRRSIFRDKVDGQRVQGIITREGGAAFEAARRKLAELAKRKADQISDADTVEFLARGARETREYLKVYGT